MIGLRVACCAAFFAQAISIIARPTLPPGWFWFEVLMAICSVFVGTYVLFRGTEA